MPVPSELEILTLKIIDSDGKGILCVGCYRPPSQGTTLLDFLTVNLDAMLTASQCDSVVSIGDLNQHRVRDAFDTLLVVHDLHNYVTFPTHCHPTQCGLLLWSRANLFTNEDILNTLNNQ